MLLPYPVIDQLTPQQVRLWHDYFAGKRHERARNVEEGIWRRTQDPANTDQSGWSTDDNGRRRIVHYRHRYALDHTQPVPRLVLTQLYLYHSLTGPADEMDTWRKDIDTWLHTGGWSPATTGHRRGDLRVNVDDVSVHAQDERAGRATPPGHRTVDVTVRSHGCRLSRPARNLPWDVLAGGIRIKDQRGAPRYAEDLRELRDHLPFQVELGCGPSIEAGIPPLHYLHEVYRVTARRDNTLTQAHPFTLAPHTDPLIRELLTEPETKTEDLVRMFRSCFQANPTPAHHALRALHQAGAMTGPVITHNFDLLAARAGLAECFVRRYDQRIPHVPLQPETRALLVIGLHADRRAVQARARTAGKKIFYLDTEGLTENGAFREYPIEGARDGDVIVRAPATTGLRRLCHLLNITPDPRHRGARR
ncbi:hypothetical protein GCM10010245_82970 [Streptomyces spectabilis]|uniref:Uncharacterized protein n=1 Tax=Streptomyces spectabilis TaxID=68270 RepID=A0A7W8B2X1_STRST|nr:hypothetical protein [Streptomyces spectabilis]MBB5109365.1 hypothetical protein [Streptomyces spectabilis]GGV52625.1 hypothetical protein GCM10010245_82970 [Streptomyces spectabilis]